MINPNQLGRSPFPADASQWMLVGLRGGAVAPPFDPTTITGLKLWLKADSLVLADGTAVGTWTDSSGLGNNATQSTGANQPLFRTNRINGLPALKFDGVNDCMAANMLGAVTTGDSIFIVQRKNVLSPTLAMASLTDPSTASPPTNSFAVYLPYSDNNIYFDLGDSTATGRISSAWGGDYTNFFVWSFVAGGGNMAVYRNGTTVVSSGGHTNVFTPAGLTLSISGFFTACQDADIAEILIYNVALNTTDRQNVENYLKTKYALP